MHSRTFNIFLALALTFVLGCTKKAAETTPVAATSQTIEAPVQHGAGSPTLTAPSGSLIDSLKEPNGSAISAPVTSAPAVAKPTRSKKIKKANRAKRGKLAKRKSRHKKRG